MVEYKLKPRPYVIGREGELDYSQIRAIPGSTCSSFKNKRGCWLFTRAWETPNEQRRGVIVFHHGICASSNTYLFSKEDNKPLGLHHFAKQCTENGFSLYAFDAESHGYSESSLENPNEKFFIPGHEDSVEDFELYISMVLGKPANQGKPLFLYGASWGGAIALLTCYKWQRSGAYPFHFAGLFLCAPAIHADLPDPVTIFMLKNIVANLIPKRIPFFMPHPISVERLTDEPAVIEYLWNDPYTNEGKPFRLAVATALLAAIVQVQEDLPKYKFPVCIVHGSNDAGVPPTGSLAVKEESQCVVKDVLILQDCKHAIEFDVVNQEAMNNHFLNFMRSQIAAGAHASDAEWKSARPDISDSSSDGSSARSRECCS